MTSCLISHLLPSLPSPLISSEITRVGRAVHAVLNDAELSTHVLGNPVDISGLRATATFVGFEASPADAQQTLARAAPAPTATTTATAPTETAAAESQSPPADAEQSSAVAARVAAAMQEVDDRDRLRQTLQDKADASEAQVNAVLAAFKQLQASHPGAPLYDFLSTVVQMQQREEPETSSVDDLASTTVADWQRGLQWMQAYDEEIAKLTQSPSSSSSSDSSAEVNSAASKTAEDSPASAQRKTPRRPKNSRATDPAEPDARR